VNGALGFAIAVGLHCARLAPELWSSGRIPEISAGEQKIGVGSGVLIRRDGRPHGPNPAQKTEASTPTRYFQFVGLVVNNLGVTMYKMVVRRVFKPLFIRI